MRQASMLKGNSTGFIPSLVVWRPTICCIRSEEKRLWMRWIYFPNTEEWWFMTIGVHTITMRTALTHSAMHITLEN
jgi:hypothetical protein